LEFGDKDQKTLWETVFLKQMGVSSLHVPFRLEARRSFVHRPGLFPKPSQCHDVPSPTRSKSKGQSLDQMPYDCLSARSTQHQRGIIPVISIASLNHAFHELAGCGKGSDATVDAIEGAGSKSGMFSSSAFAWSRT